MVRPSLPEAGEGIPRAATGVTGLDDILGGGLPTNHLYLIDGEPGTGKTTLALQFLLDGVANGERGLYVTLSESAAELRAVANSHGWELDGIEIFELSKDAAFDIEEGYTIFHPAEVELQHTVDEVLKAVEKHNPGRVAFDSLSEMRLLAREPLRFRRQILALKQFFNGRDCTVLLLDDKTAPEGDLQLHSLAHAKDGRLAAARRADEDEQLAIPDFEAEIARGDVAVRVNLVDALKCNSGHSCSS